MQPRRSPNYRRARTLEEHYDFCREKIEREAGIKVSDEMITELLQEIFRSLLSERIGHRASAMFRSGKIDIEAFIRNGPPPGFRKKPEAESAEWRSLVDRTYTRKGTPLPENEPPLPGT